MVRLIELLEPLPGLSINRSAGEIEINGLAYHSDQVSPGSLFFCLTGYRRDGHLYAAEAVSRGAAAVVASHRLSLPVPVITVWNTREALALAAARFYHFPGNRMNLIGVTGTNGKTTTTYFLDSIWRESGKKSAIIGSNGLLVGGELRRFDLTTPQSLDLQESLALLLTKNIANVAMEVSSHALVQDRVAFCSFQAAVFTNLTREHLDYHRSMSGYLQAKSSLLTLLKDPAARAVFNADDRWFYQLRALTRQAVITYGVRDCSATIRASRLKASPAGSYSFYLLGWKEPFKVNLRLPGIFNVYNALAAAAVAWKERLPATAVAKGLSLLRQVPGRMEEIVTTEGFTVIIDFAHTPDSLKKVLRLLQQRLPQRVITVFGCPGERDRGKRPIMGRIAERYSQLVILTADNPARENPEKIIEEIKSGMSSSPVIILDRLQAVGYALSQARPGDIVLLAGKGAEEYQVVGDRHYPYSERKVVEDYLRHRG